MHNKLKLTNYPVLKQLTTSVDEEDILVWSKNESETTGGPRKTINVVTVYQGTREATETSNSHSIEIFMENCW